MSAIRERLLCCLAGVALCAGAAVWLAFSATWHAAIFFAAAAVGLLGLALRTLGSYRSARLICLNPILNVGVASVAENGGVGRPESRVNVVVSGFGIMLDGKPYKFGRDGIALREVRIDRESIALSFGGEERTYAVRLLHGVTDRADVERLRTRLRYETGVAAEVSGWQ